MDIQTSYHPRFRKSAQSLKTALLKAREILTMATLSPVSSGSRLQTPSGSISDLSDCSQSSDYGYSALHGAIISHDTEYLAFLLNSGCELDQRDENGFTALHVGTLQKSIDGVQMLIDAGCNIEKLTKEGMSSLHIAVDLQNNHEVLTLLATSFPNINIENKVGRTALHLSAKSGNQEYLKILLDAGCDRDIKDKFGFKAVDIARVNDHDDCVQLLLHYVARKRIFEKLIKEENSNSRALSNNVNFSILGEKKKELNKTEQFPAKDAETKDKFNITMECDSNSDVLLNSIYKVNLENASTTSLAHPEKEEGVVDIQPEAIKTHKKDQSRKDNVSSGNIPTAMFFELQCDDEKKYISSELISEKGKTSSSHNQELLECVNDSPYFENDENDADDLPCHSSLSTSCTFIRESSMSSSTFYQQTTISSNKLNGKPSSDVSLHNTKTTNSAAILPTRKAPRNGCRIHYNYPINMKELHILLIDISKLVNHTPDYSKSFAKRKEYVDFKEELLSCMTTPFSPLSSFSIAQENLCYEYKALNNYAYRTKKLRPNDILCQLLKGLDNTMMNPITFSRHCTTIITSNVKISPENKLNSCQLMQERPEDFVEMFLAVSQDIALHREDACKLLDKLCTHLNSQNASYIETFVDSVFTRTKLTPISDTNEQIPLRNLVRILLTLEYVIQQNKNPIFFASSVLENLVSLSPVVMTTRPEFMKITIGKCLTAEESFWDEDTIVQIFLFVSHLLVNTQYLMFKCVDVLLRPAFSCSQIDDLTLCSCILMRLGLLKSEYKIHIFPHLKGPLLALAHLLAQDYFQVCFAGLFVSFLAKPRLRFRKVREEHLQALEAAMLKEIQDQNVLLGKGLKRICDVLAHGEYWATAYQCCDALFNTCFYQHAKCTPMEHGTSILVYFGLIKSEFPIEEIQDIKNGLTLLQHAVNGRKIPEEIVEVLIIFLEKSNRRLSPYKKEVTQLLASMNK